MKPKVAITGHRRQTELSIVVDKVQSIQRCVLRAREEYRDASGQVCVGRFSPGLQS